MYFRKNISLLIMLLLSVPIGYGALGFFLGAIGEGEITTVIDRVNAALKEFNSGTLIRSAFFSIKVALLSTLLALLLCYFFTVYAISHNRYFWLSCFMLCLFIIPHSTFAILIEQILSNAGLTNKIIRIIQGTSIDTSSKPISLSNHPSGFVYIISMALKESPFIWFLILSNVFSESYQQQIKVAQSLGYQKNVAILGFILPQIYSHLKLPLIAVIIFIMGHVEMALIIAPFEPETLGVKILMLFNEPDMLARQQAFIIGCLLMCLSLVTILIFIAVMWVCKWLFCFVFNYALKIQKGLFISWIIHSTQILFVLIVMVLIIGLVGLIILSFAMYRPLEKIMPEGFTLIHWQEIYKISKPLLLNTLLIALSSVLMSIFIVVFLIETTHKTKRLVYLQWLLSIPLLIPTVGFLLGIVFLLNQVDNLSPFLTVIIGHMLFIMPYCFFILQKPLTTFDNRWIYTSLSLGKSYLYTYLFIKLRLLKNPVIFTFLLGIIISFNQYLPTLLLSGGQVETLNSQAIIFAQGGSKRLLATFALMQILLALFVLGIGWIAWCLTGKKRV